MEETTAEHPSWINTAIAKLDKPQESKDRNFSSSAGILVRPPTSNLDTSYYVSWSRWYSGR